MVLDVTCPDCKARLRINTDKVPGHCYYCGRLIKVNPDSLEVEPGPGEEKDIIQTQYKGLKEIQDKNRNNRTKIVNNKAIVEHDNKS
ncbi:MAG: hypothetical protein K6E10_12560 [Eubacterium sp.]|nr:hypothetical protein [Eubacterium sp.]